MLREKKRLSSWKGNYNSLVKAQGTGILTTKFDMKWQKL